ncbi:MAG: hypothetical protein QXT26_00845 [Thermoproteota archaeon]
MPSTSELWRISKTVYREIFFQSNISFRTGGMLPQSEVDIKKNIENIIKNIKFSTDLSKGMMSFFIVFLVGFAFSPGFFSKVDRELVAISSVSSTLGSVLFIILFMSIQVTTSFVSSRISDILVPLPFSKKDVSKILLMCFIRIFDIPLITAILAIPIAYGLLYGSILGASVVLLSVVITEIFALTISIILALSFYNKVVRGGGGSGFRILIRFFYMIIWIIPFFFSYVAFSFATYVIELMKTISQNVLHMLALLYPFSLGFLAALATFPFFNHPNITVISISSSLIYFTLAVYSFKWLIRKVVSIGLGSIAAGARVAAGKIFINIEKPWLEIIKKDFRIASRSPSYFSMLAMPVLQTIILTSSFSSVFKSINLDSSNFTSIGLLPFQLLIVPTVSLFMVLILPPTLLSMETLAYSYVRSLPLKKKTMIIAKIVLTSIIYLFSLLTMLLLASIMVPHLLLLLIILNGILAFSIIASIIIETLLISRALMQEISGGIYFKTIFYILPMIIGLITAFMPLLVHSIILLIANSPPLSMIISTIVSISELLIALLLLITVR